MTPPVIVVGGGSANGLGIARNLGHRGIPVYCVTSDPHELLRYSKYCQGCHIVAHIERDAPTLSRVLQAFRSTIPGTGVLYPTTDTALLTVAQLQETMMPYVTYLPSRKIVEMMVIKSRFYKSLETTDIPYPRTLYPEEIEVQTIDRLHTFPVFIRPAQTLLYTAQFPGKGFVAQNRRELYQYLHLAKEQDLEVMIQEIIPGPVTAGYTLRGYLNHDSRPLVLYATQKLRQPTMFSNNTAWVTIPLSRIQEITAPLLRYFQAIGYRGLFGAEFKQDPRDGVFKLLEVNARSMGGNYLGAACGANHVFAAYRDTLGQPIPPSTPYRSGIYYVNLLEDLIAIVKTGVRRQWTRNELRPFIGPVQWQQLSRDDPLPFLHLLRIYLSKLASM
jgi:predicted ATP-grasp superfamily ATP-dependent carboligase